MILIIEAIENERNKGEAAISVGPLLTPESVLRSDAKKNIDDRYRKNKGKSVINRGMAPLSTAESGMRYDPNDRTDRNRNK